jgi:fatty-acyl-CoA synthase
MKDGQATTLATWIDAIADAHLDAPALTVAFPPGDNGTGPSQPDAGQSVTYGELAGRCRRLAAGLSATGLARGDRIASMLPNGERPVELLLAAARLGAVTIGVNTRFRSEDLRHVLQRGKPKLLVAAGEWLGIDFEGVISGAVAGLDQPPAVIWDHQLEPLYDTAELASDLAAPSDLLVAFTTSGTTGKPKLAAHSHTSTIAHVTSASRSLSVGPASIGLLVLPLCGTFGFVTAMSVLAGGGHLVLSQRFDPARTAELIEQYGVTHLNASDDMILAVVEQDRDLTSWRHGVTAEFTGRGLESVKAAERAGARVTGVYGSSETFALLARWPEDQPAELRARAGGRFVDPAHEVRIVEGEIQFRGPSVLDAYLAEDETLPPPLARGGWFATGDLGESDGPGEFRYVARMGDALRLRGFLTDPAEIEQSLMDIPGIEGAQVVGTAGPGGGDVAVAFVVATRDIDEQEMLSHCRQGLANYKVPARVVAIHEFPTVDGPNGVKIRKAELRRLAAELMRAAPLIP